MAILLNLVKSNYETCPIVLILKREIIIITSRVPVGGKASVCLICMKYRIIILIIIIKRLGEILLSYIAHTLRTHTPLPFTHLYLYHKGKGVCG